MNINSLLYSLLGEGEFKFNIDYNNTATAPAAISLFKL